MVELEKYRTVVQKAKSWGISTRRVRILCATGRIHGAIQTRESEQNRGHWLIPANARRPADKRFKNQDIQ